MRAGGERFDYVPALNARASHAQCLAELIVEHCQGWTHLEHGRAPSAARGTSA
jgi:ferrochelatase